MHAPTKTKQHSIIALKGSHIDLYQESHEIDYLCFRQEAHEESPDCVPEFKAQHLPQFNASLSDPSIRRVYVARLGSDIIGHIAFKLDRDRTTIKLISFYVLKKHRNQGIGSRLYKKLDDFATEVNAVLITHHTTIHNTTTQNFFARFKFWEAVPDIEHDDVVHYQLLTSA